MPPGVAFLYAKKPNGGGYMLENVKIGNVNYSVEYVPLVSRFDTLRGEINYVDRNIRIEDSMTAEDTHETLLHEVIHGIDNFMEIGLTEEHVSKISKGIHMVMTDNPQLFRHPSVTSEIQEAVNHAAVHIVDDIEPKVTPGFTALASKLRTKELVEELKRRTGVDSEKILLGEDRQFHAHGPCTIISVTD